MGNYEFHVEYRFSRRSPYGIVEEMKATGSVSILGGRNFLLGEPKNRGLHLAITW